MAPSSRLDNPIRQVVAVVKRHRGPLRKRKSHLWVRDKHDFYVEPEWVSRRLFEVESFESVWDPSCGSGRIVQSARLHGIPALGTDIVRRSKYCSKAVDFFTIRHVARRSIVSNPPFAVAEAWVRHALGLVDRVDGKLALLLPSNWIQGNARSRWLSKTPLVRVYFICPRPSMPPGYLALSKAPPRNGTTDYGWFVWDTGRKRRRKPEIDWIFRDPEPSPRKTPAMPNRSR
jgi:hypothetical protein